MDIETLVATVDQQDHSLAEQMNLQTDAIIGNQADRNSVEVFFKGSQKITYLNTDGRGVGRNRNLVLQHASADICIFADDDMRFLDGYPETARKAVRECPDGDVFIFNLLEKNPKRYLIKKTQRVRWYNYARNGAARVAVRRQKLADAGIQFSLLFGGGARYGSGEDTIFLKECLRKGLKIYAVPYFLAEIDQSTDSTWFQGYTDKFFRDKGALYACLYRWLWPVYVLRYSIRYRERYAAEMSVARAMRQMISGGIEFKRNGKKYIADAQGNSSPQPIR